MSRLWKDTFVATERGWQWLTSRINGGNNRTNDVNTSRNNVNKAAQKGYLTGKVNGRKLGYHEVSFHRA